LAQCLPASLTTAGNPWQVVTFLVLTIPFSN
jgi:hypothetical protein